MDTLGPLPERQNLPCSLPQATLRLLISAGNAALTCGYESPAFQAFVSLSGNNAHQYQFHYLIKTVCILFQTQRLCGVLSDF